MTRVVNRIKGLLDVHGVVVPIVRALPCSGSALVPPASPLRARSGDACRARGHEAAAWKVLTVRVGRGAPGNDLCQCRVV